MASLDLYEATEESWATINDLSEQMACNPLFRADEVVVMQQMADALRLQMDQMIGPTYYEASEQMLERYKSNLDDLVRLMRKLIKLKAAK